MGSGHVNVVPAVKEAASSGDVSGLTYARLDTDNFEWPNDVRVVPYDVFKQRAIVVPDGFLVPGHSNGGVYVVTIDDNDITKATSTVKISTEPKGYFYHMGEWIDLNRDGRKDFLTARSNAKENGGELVWFEHPKEGLSGEWIEHVVCAGPDVGITVEEVRQYKHEVVVFAAEFFNEKLSFYRVSTKDGTLVDSRVIDDSEIMSAYSVTYTDLNGDGTKELLVNNHETKDKNSGIWAYHMPKNWMTGDFSRTTLASNFHNAFSLMVPNMSPGFPYPFHARTKPKWNELPHILVAGDGDHTAHVMTATDSNFNYDLDTIKEYKGTVGSLAFADLNGDGLNELWVPDYDHGFIELFSVSEVSNEVASLNESHFLQ